MSEIKVILQLERGTRAGGLGRCYQNSVVRIFIERMPSSEKEGVSDIRYSCYSQTLQQKEPILPAVELASVFERQNRGWTLFWDSHKVGQILR